MNNSKKAITIQSKVKSTRDLYLALSDRVRFSLIIDPILRKESIEANLEVIDSLIALMPNKNRVLRYSII